MAINPRHMSAESINRALDHHKREGRISDWKYNYIDQARAWTVWLNRDFEPEVCKTKREIGLVLAGLTSAGYNKRTVATRELADDLAKHGLRADLQPTMDFGGDANDMYRQMTAYLARVDRNVRELASAAVNVCVCPAFFLCNHDGQHLAACPAA